LLITYADICIDIIIGTVTIAASLKRNFEVRQEILTGTGPGETGDIVA
jgi:hypothetical protein